AGLDGLLRLFTRVLLEGTRDHHRLAGEDLGEPADLDTAEVDSGPAQLLDERAVGLDRVPAADRAGDHRADTLCRGQRGLVGGKDRVEGAEGEAQRLAR